MMFLKPPTKEEMQYFDQCFYQMFREGDFVVCVVREYPNSSELRGFRDRYVFGAIQQAVKWLSANRVH